MWIVDTCVLLDVFEDDPSFGEASADFLEAHRAEGLAVSPVTMIELAAAFDGDTAEQKRFLDTCGVSYAEPWTAGDVEASQRAWNEYVRDRRRNKAMPRRPIADLMIGGFAANRQGLITRNPDDFRRWYPRLALRCPRAP